MPCGPSTDPWPQELRAPRSVREDNDPVLAVDSTLGDGRDHRTKDASASPPSVHAPDATQRVEQAHRLGFDEPRPREPVNQHHDGYRGEGEADPDAIGDHDGNNPVHDAPYRGEDRQRSQGEQGDDQENPTSGSTDKRPPKGPMKSSMSGRTGTASRSSGLSSWSGRRFHGGWRLAQRRRTYQTRPSGVVTRCSRTTSKPPASGLECQR